VAARLSNDNDRRTKCAELKLAALIYNSKYREMKKQCAKIYQLLFT